MIILVPPGACAPGDLLELAPDETHHLRVRRAGHGEVVGLRNGVGLVGSGTLELGGKAAHVRVTAARQVPAPRVLRLVVATGDRDRFGWMVEKAGELGVTAIQPVETTRSRSVATRTTDAHAAKLARRALEATKQSGAAWAPVIEPVAELPQVAAGASGIRWLADAEGSWPDAGAGTPDAVMVGPEGGLTPEERERLVAAGWVPVRLSSAILRFETAAIAAAAWIGIARQGGTDE